MVGYITSDVSFYYYLNYKSCYYCMKCVNNCPNGSLKCVDKEFSIDKSACLRCEICKNVCPNQCIEINFGYGDVKNVSERVNQEIFITNIKEE